MEYLVQYQVGWINQAPVHISQIFDESQVQHEQVAVLVKKELIWVMFSDVLHCT